MIVLSHTHLKSLWTHSVAPLFSIRHDEANPIASGSFHPHLHTPQHTQIHQNLILCILTSPSIWICLTGESRVPVEDTTAVAAEVESLREAMIGELNHEKRRSCVKDGNFRYQSVSLVVRVGIFVLIYSFQIIHLVNVGRWIFFIKK
jgi:hypothetical protein